MCRGFSSQVEHGFAVCSPCSALLLIEYFDVERRMFGAFDAYGMVCVVHERRNQMCSLKH